MADDAAAAVRQIGHQDEMNAVAVRIRAVVFGKVQSGGCRPPPGDRRSPGGQRRGNGQITRPAGFIIDLEIEIGVGA